MINSIEIFSGAGGLALGLQMAGFNHVALYERDAAACKNIRYNLHAGYLPIKTWKVIQADVRSVSYKQFEEKISLLAGGPEKFLPVWNCLLEGFGNHDPDKGRKNMVIPAWDFYHPGRTWAERLESCSKTTEQIDKEIRDYLNKSCL